MFKKGFTLIELLIVFAIIGILAAIVIPNVIALKNKHKEKQIQQNFKEARKKQAPKLQQNIDNAKEEYKTGREL